MKQLFYLGALLFSLAASAEIPPPPEERIPLRNGDIVIDGKADDPGWRNAAAIRLDRPPFGETAQLRPAELRLVWDGAFLYLLFSCSDADLLPAGEKRDDPLYAGDAVEIFLDGVGDGRQFYEIQLNPSGLVCDINHFFTGETVKLDGNGLYTDWANVWDDPGFELAGLRVAASSDAAGYRVECAIPAAAPLRRLNRRKLAAGDRFRANFIRLDRRADGGTAVGCWSPTVPGRPHRSPGRMGTLILDPGNNQLSKEKP